MPKTDADQVTVQADLRYGVAVSETERVKDRLEQSALRVIERFQAQSDTETEVVEGVFTLVGQSLVLRSSPGQASSSGGSHLTGVQVFLVPSGERDFSATAFAEAWRKELGEVPGLEALVFRHSAGPGSETPGIEVELVHDSIDVLEAAASEVAAALRTFGGLKDIDDGFSQGKPQLDFSLTPVGKTLGLTAADAGEQVRSALYGAEALRQQRGRDEVRVMVRLPEAERASEYGLEQLILRAPSGGEIPLAEAVAIERGYAYTSIGRADGRRVVTVTADVVPGVGNAGKVLASLEKDVLPAIQARYLGLSYSFEGDRRGEEEALGALAQAAPLALIVIFALLAIPFGSYLQPVVVLSAIPFGLVGAIIGHVLLGYDLSLISVLGVVAASGIVINDSLVLVHAANAYRDEGHSALEAVRRAGVRRFRPILLTSLTTFFGLVPMILETSVQARFLIPMAISLAFGEMFSTVVILVLVPALYLILEDGVQLVMGAPNDLDKTPTGPPRELQLPYSQDSV